MLMQKNLKTLDHLFPGIAKLIKERKEKLLKKEQIEIEEEIAFNGETILKVKKEGRILYLAGRRDPAGPAKNQIALLGKIEATAPIFMVGLGNIHYLEELLKATDKSTMVFIYEPCFSIFYKQLQLIDFKELFKDRIIVLCIEGINEDGYESLLRPMLLGDRCAIMKNFILPNYEVICYEQVYKFMRSLDKEATEYQATVNTRLRFSTVKVDNIFHNLNYIRLGYKVGELPFVLPRDVPAIVVSAGPSLNKNIEDLKKAKGRAFIIAVDTAMKPLLNAGIIPDMFAIVDGLKPLNLIELEASKEIPLVTSDDAAKAVLEYHTGKKFFFNQNRKYINHMYQMNGKELERLQVGGSVATLALSLVCHVGFKTVILVGQDLAYTDNKTHADGTFKEKMDTIDTTNFKMVEGNYEELVPTDATMNAYKEWMEDFIEFWRKNAELKVINATAGGAKIKGTEILPLSDAIQQECTKTVDIQACFNKLSPAFSKEEQGKILQFFHETPSEFHKIILLADEGKKAYKKLQKMCSSINMDKNGYLKLLRKIKRINKKIENSVVYNFVEETVLLADQIIRTGQYQEYGSFEEEGLEIARKGIQYMDLLKQCASLFEKLAQETIGIIQE
ncbi:MAG: DUF115 domain-containing protein [Lachnospiraceae bacterium]|nr:DUF115 domain-containing protein [Lachnospiraceae bacterium]